jgi:hypothetical protein
MRLVVALGLFGWAMSACSDSPAGALPDGPVPDQLVYDVARCDGSSAMDPFEISSAEIRIDELHVALTHSGNCRPHVFRLCWNGTFFESDPVVVNVTVSHDAQGDRCSASISSEFRFGLIPMKRQFQRNYATEAGTINVLGKGIAGFYTFTE